MRRYKDLWFAEFERLQNENPGVPDDMLAEQANQDATDKLAAMIDQAADRDR